MNLFNLLPVWQLDGGRGFRALTRLQRWLAAAAAACMYAVTHEGLLLLIAIAAGASAAFSPAAEDADQTAFLEYASLVVVLAALTRIVVPGVTP